MLGDKRGNSLFAQSNEHMPESSNIKVDQPVLEQPVTKESHTADDILSDRLAPKASTVFYAPAQSKPFAEVLEEVQAYLSGEYSTLITEGGEESKSQMKRLIARYLGDKRIAVDSFTPQELTETLYTEMAEYGFLTKYIFAEDIEEIDINSWRDVEVQYADGRNVKLNEHFTSPEHASNVVRRMLQNSGKVLDNASPIVTSRLARNIRVAVIKSPVRSTRKNRHKKGGKNGRKQRISG